MDQIDLIESNGPNRNKMDQIEPKWTYWTEQD